MPERIGGSSSPPMRCPFGLCYWCASSRRLPIFSLNLKLTSSPVSGFEAGKKQLRFDLSSSNGICIMGEEKEEDG